jgi:hypothetical protein
MKDYIFQIFVLMLKKVNYIFKLFMVQMFRKLSKTRQSRTSKHEAGLLNKWSCLASTLGATKFVIIIGKNLVTLSCAA